jgi:hypothetical protein
MSMDSSDYTTLEWDYDEEKKLFTEDFRIFESYKNKSQYDWHLFYVFHDINFLVFNDLIRQKYLKVIKRRVDGTLKPEAAPNVAGEYELLVAQLCNMFDIHPNDLEKFNDTPDARWTEPIYIRGKKQPIIPETRIHFDLSSIATAADLIKAHKQAMKDIGVKQPRRREYEHPDLVYAIHANRMLDRTFLEIYEDYRARKLTGYRKKSTPTFDGYDSLRRYYAKYKTDIKAHPDT